MTQANTYFFQNQQEYCESNVNELKLKLNEIKEQMVEKDLLIKSTQEKNEVIFKWQSINFW